MGKAHETKGKTNMKNTDQNKEMILEQLKKVPIIEAACQKTDISRMTFYRWKKEDETFSKSVDEALASGRLLVNDLAENQLIGAVKDQNLSAVQYWLKHHHPDYANKLQVSHQMKDESLTLEQEEIVRKALSLASLPPAEEINTHLQENSNEQIPTNPEGTNRSNDQGSEDTNSNN